MTEYCENHKRGLLIVFCGPSGVGKGTVLKKFLEHNQECVLSISATTRCPRAGETDGKDYFFVSRERFSEIAATGGMLEYAEYNGNFYGTPKAAVEELLKAGRNVILEIEIQGALKIKELNLGAVFIFVMPPSWEALRQRLRDRNTETPESMTGRLGIAIGEIEKACLFDYIIINDHLDKCLDEISAVIKAAGCGACYRENLIREVLEDAQTIDVSDH